MFENWTRPPQRPEHLLHSQRDPRTISAKHDPVATTNAFFFRKAVRPGAGHRLSILRHRFTISAGITHSSAAAGTSAKTRGVSCTRVWRPVAAGPARSLCWNCGGKGEKKLGSSIAQWVILVEYRGFSGYTRKKPFKQGNGCALTSFLSNNSPFRAATRDARNAP